MSNVNTKSNLRSFVFQVWFVIKIPKLNTQIKWQLKQKLSTLNLFLHYYPSPGAE